MKKHQTHLLDVQAAARSGLYGLGPVKPEQHRVERLVARHAWDKAVAPVICRFPCRTGVDEAAVDVDAHHVVGLDPLRSVGWWRVVDGFDTGQSPRKTPEESYHQVIDMHLDKHTQRHAPHASHLAVGLWREEREAVDKLHDDLERVQVGVRQPARDARVGADLQRCVKHPGLVLAPNLKPRAVVGVVNDEVGHPPGCVLFCARETEVRGGYI